VGIQGEREQVYMAAGIASLERLKAEFARLPGIGARSAERLAYHVLRSGSAAALALAEAIREVKTRVRPCSACFNLDEQDPCWICRDEGRDRTTICVVEQPKDLVSIEQTGGYRGLYHVLMGRIAPLEDAHPEDLTLSALSGRVAGGEVREVILATNPTIEGDGTALHIQALLEATGVKLTRLARGLPAGAQIEYANAAILSDALAGRTPLS
jgi:recombination protein RecR